MYDILFQFQIRAKPLAVFDAFTSPQGLNSWWTAQSSGIPEVGAIYQFYFGPAYDWRAKVVHVVRVYELTWQVIQAMEDWMGTMLGFKLSETDDGCTVRFFHRNWPHQGDHFAISSFCWGQLLRGLKEYVEQGSIIPFANRN